MSMSVSPATATAVRASISTPVGPVTRTRARIATPRAPSSKSTRSEEHTSELQSQSNLVCRLLLEEENTHRPLLNADAIGDGRQDLVSPQVSRLQPASSHEPMPARHTAAVKRRRVVLRTMPVLPML